MTTCAERVASGAAFLDEKVPGWANRIDLNRLDMSYTNCVLAQLFGSPGRAIDEFGLTPCDFALDGFEGRTDEDVLSLDAAWKTQVENRLTVGGRHDDHH